LLLLRTPNCLRKLRLFTDCNSTAFQKPLSICNSEGCGILTYRRTFIHFTPESLIHISPESLFTISRNDHSHAPWNTHTTGATPCGSREGLPAEDRGWRRGGRAALAMFVGGSGQALAYTRAARIVDGLDLGCGQRAIEELRGPSRCGDADESCGSGRSPCHVGKSL